MLQILFVCFLFGLFYRLVQISARGVVDFCFDAICLAIDIKNIIVSSFKFIKNKIGGNK